MPPHACVQTLTLAALHRTTYTHTTWHSNGDADYILSHMGNAAWVSEGLQLNKSAEWAAWRGSDGQVAGYFEEYETAGKPLTFLTVKGAGHMVPKDRPKHALDMLSRFLAGGGYANVSRAATEPLCAPAA